MGVGWGMGWWCGSVCGGGGRGRGIALKKSNAFHRKLLSFSI